jgi:transposase
MKRFIQEQDRTQGTLLPECLDDYITDENSVRVIDAFVDGLDLLAFGFFGAARAKTGRPVYHPAVLLKLYIYGYLNRIQSSRRLEKEAQRHVELMWLTGRLIPDFKTIANFRKDNGQGIQNVCWQDQTTTLEPDGHYLLEIPYNDDRELLNDILALIPDVDVLAPASLPLRVRTALLDGLR